MSRLTPLTSRQIALTAAIAILSPLTLAQEQTQLPLWELGAVGLGVSQQAYPGADQQVDRRLILPTFFYRGKFFHADRDSAGIRAVKTSHFELDVGFSASLGSNSKDVEARAGMPNLGNLLEFGPKAKWVMTGSPGGGRWLAELPLRGAFDLSEHGKHRGMSLEPRLIFEQETITGWRYSTSLSAVFGDERLAGVFYEVRPEYALNSRPAYKAKSGLIAWRLNATLSRIIDPDWRVFSFARIDNLSGAANEGSPLVLKKTGATIGVGVAYTWKRSSQMAGE